MMEFLPKPLRISLDFSALGVGAIHFLGWWQTHAGTVATTAGLIWLLIQASYFFYDRYFKKDK